MFAAGHAGISGAAAFLCLAACLERIARRSTVQQVALGWMPALPPACMAGRTGLVAYCHEYRINPLQAARQTETALAETQRLAASLIFLQPVIQRLEADAERFCCHALVPVVMLQCRHDDFTLGF